MKLSGWGNLHPQDCHLSRPRDLTALRDALRSGPVIARGNGRAYGDSALALGGTLDMRGLNRMLAFDSATGQLVAEAGVLLSEVIEVFLPRGWFPIVTPGTRHVTLGGMVASDVHGKNHHLDGGFGGCIDWIELLDAAGDVRRISRNEGAALFRATIGGMGLTGIILRLAFRLRRVESGWVLQETIATPDLDATIDAFEAHHAAPYSVAWIDCLSRGERLGRSLLTLGRHAALADLSQSQRRAPFWPAEKRRLSFPFPAPGFALNRHSVAGFNALYYEKGRRNRGQALVSWESYFYPLDAIAHWNRMYGRRGFLQYQCVLPLDAARHGLRALLEATSEAGLGSFLAVLKRLGPEGEGMLSFPMEGYTLALDFPNTPRTLPLLRALEGITLAHRGRHYLTKDAVLCAEQLRASDPRVEAFAALRRDSGMAARFASLQSERLSL